MRGRGVRGRGVWGRGVSRGGATGTDTPARLTRLLRINAVGLGGSALALIVLAVTRIHDVNLYRDVAALLVAVLLVVAGLVALRRGRVQGPALAVLAANWIVAAALAYASPFTLPISLLAIIAPVVLVFDVLRPAILSVVVAATVAGAGALAGIGELRRAKPDVLQPKPSLTVPLVSVFVAVVSLMIVAGIREQVHRLRAQARDLDASRRRLTTAADEARQEIERDLHDGAQQRLVRLSVDLGRITRLGERDPAAAMGELPALHEDLLDGIRELRNLAHGIYPALLAERGLGSALPAAARRSSLPCTVTIDPDARYPAEVETALYFCCLEAIHNADKHSGAQAIAVTVTPRSRALAFTVADDGRGLDPALAGPSRGITGMIDRIRAAGGDCSVTSTPGSGTLVSGWLPLGAPR